MYIWLPSLRSRSAALLPAPLRGQHTRTSGKDLSPPIGVPIDQRIALISGASRVRLSVCSRRRFWVNDTGFSHGYVGTLFLKCRPLHRCGGCRVDARRKWTRSRSDRDPPQLDAHLSMHVLPSDSPRLRCSPQQVTRRHGKSTPEGGAELRHVRKSRCQGDLCYRHIGPRRPLEQLPSSLKSLVL